MPLLGELRLQATRENLLPVTYFIHSIASSKQLVSASLQENELLLEEAITQIIHFAYPKRAPGEMLIRMELGDSDDEMLIVSLLDWGDPFDMDLIPLGDQITIERKTATESGAANVLTLRSRIERSDAGSLTVLDRELNAIQTISEMMTTNIEVDALLKMIVDKLVEAVGAERGTLYLVDEERGELYSKVLLEDSNVLSEIRVKIGEGLAGHVALTGEVVNVHHAYEDERFNRSIDQRTGFHTETILSAPLRTPRQKLIGVAQLVNKSRGEFTSRDERLLVAMASQAAISIENSRLYAREIQQRLTIQELNTGRNIQRSFMPATLPQRDGWDIAARWEPAHTVSGDFYDLQRLDANRWAICIGDVSGKGVPAALFMALTVTVLRFAIDMRVSCSQLLQQANRLILSFNEQSKMFATIFVGYLDTASGELHFASGGHNPPLLYRAGSGRFERLTARGIIVGLLDEVSFVEEQVILEPGDVLVMYTDGITEAMTDSHDEFGLERLEAVIQSCASAGAQELTQAVIENVAAFTGNVGLFDDETLVVIKRIAQS